MWQWYIHWPGRSSGRKAIVTRLFAATFTVSSHDLGIVGSAVHRDDLEEEPVQVKRVIHAGLVDDVPDLQLAHLHGRVVVVLSRR